MKIKLFILIILFLGIGAVCLAQSQPASASEKKETPKAQVVTTEKSVPAAATVDHTKGQCKWVDANGDGKCDTCGKTEKECKENCTPAPKKSGCSSACPMHKECGEAPGTTPSKDGKK